MRARRDARAPGGFAGAGRRAARARRRDPRCSRSRSAGRGRALLLADAAPLQNRLLGRADNAALGLALAGAGRGGR